MSEFKNRVFGCAIVKAINTNYNADFTGQPRTLPDGVVYATDKTFKYSIRNHLVNNYPDEIVLFYKSFNEDLNPLTLAESYLKKLGEKTDSNEKQDSLEKADKPTIIKKLLSCIDVRLFGATFAPKGSGQNRNAYKGKNISIHGPVQVNHAINRFPENSIYSEQILSPFRNPEEKGKEEKEASTLGQQSRLREGHYVHHFSINPKNLNAVRELAGGASGLSNADIEKLKEAMCKGVSYYDSTSKAGTDNELLLWVQIKEASKLVLPVFTEFINITRDNDSIVIDFGGLKEILKKVDSDIERIELFYNHQNTKLVNEPEKAVDFDIITMKEIDHEH